MRRRGLALALLALSAPLRAAETQVFASSTQAMPLFGRLGSARLSGLGGAFHSFVQGSDALLVNPAGIASVKTIEAGAHHESWLADINQETVQAVMPVGPGRAFGAYAHVVNYGEFELRDANGSRVGDMSARDYGIGVALALRGRLGFSAGLGLRGVRENLIRQDIFSLAVDTGVAWEGEDGWSGGLAAVNVGTSVAGSQGAESVRWGVSRRFGWTGGWLWPALAFSWEPQVTPRVHLGAECRLGSNLDLRAGYQHRFTQTLIDGIQGLTLGLGFKVAGLALDYAFLPHGDLGAGHRVSVSWAQAAPVSRPAAAAPEGPPLPARAAPAQPDLAYVEDPLENARTLEAAGRLGEALSDYERVAQEHPDLAGAWRGVADLAYQLKARGKAIAAYERLLALQPDPKLEAWLKAYRAEASAP